MTPYRDTSQKKKIGPLWRRIACAIGIHRWGPTVRVDLDRLIFQDWHVIQDLRGHRTCMSCGAISSVD